MIEPTSKLKFPSTFVRQYYNAVTMASLGIDFNSIQSVVELGSGGGQLAQSIRSAFPHMEYYCVDLPPQLYVSGQILKSNFPGFVRDFRYVNAVNVIQAEHPGDVTMVPNHLFPWVKPRGKTLFINIASMGEMSRDVVAIYLASVKKIADIIYLRNKASEYVSEAETSARVPTDPHCYDNWLPENKTFSGTLVLNYTEYNEMLKDEYNLQTQNIEGPISSVQYGYAGIQPTEFCKPERSHVPYFEAVWEKKCATGGSELQTEKAE